MAANCDGKKWIEQDDRFADCGLFLYDEEIYVIEGDKATGGNYCRNCAHELTEGHTERKAVKAAVLV